MVGGLRSMVTTTCGFMTILDCWTTPECKAPPPPSNGKRWRSPLCEAVRGQKLGIALPQLLERQFPQETAHRRARGAGRVVDPGPDIGGEPREENGRTALAIKRCQRRRAGRKAPCPRAPLPLGDGKAARGKRLLFACRGAGWVFQDLAGERCQLVAAR